MDHPVLLFPSSCESNPPTSFCTRKRQSEADIVGIDTNTPPPRPFQPSKVTETLLCNPILRQIGVSPDFICSR